MAKTVTTVLSHWSNQVENFSYSSKDFYRQVEEAIKQRGIPKLKVSRVNYSESGLMSAKREYLRLGRREHIFDICAAPFGNGFFVSWWLGEAQGFLYRLLSAIPFIGNTLASLVRPLTYYRIDTASMFQGSVHSAVLEVMDQIMKAKGLRLLSENERKPILQDLFKK